MTTLCCPSACLLVLALRLCSSSHWPSGGLTQQLPRGGRGRRRRAPAQMSDMWTMPAYAILWPVGIQALGTAQTRRTLPNVERISHHRHSSQHQWCHLKSTSRKA